MNAVLEQPKKINDRRNFVLLQWVAHFEDKVSFDCVKTLFAGLSQKELARPLLLIELEKIKNGQRMRSRSRLSKLYGVPTHYIRTLGKNIGLYF